MFKVSSLPRTLSAARRDIKSDDPRVRLSAARDLGRALPPGEEDARLLLLREALSDSSSEVRCRAAVSLADHEAAEAIVDLLPLLSDAHLKVREMAALALGELAPPEDPVVSGRLLSLLAAGDPALRYQALLGYARVQGSRAESEILGRSQDPDPEIRELTARLLGEYILPSGRTPAKGVAAALQRLTVDADPRVSSVAQLVSAEANLPSSYSGIVGIVAQRLPVREPQDEQWALELAGKLRLAEARPFLVKRAFGIWGMSFDPLRWTALAALGRFDDERALRRLERALWSNSNIKRAAALDALVQAELVEFLPQLRDMRSQSGEEASHLEESILALEALEREPTTD